jgi:hypothetical protein
MAYLSRRLFIGGSAGTAAAAGAAILVGSPGGGVIPSAAGSLIDSTAVDASSGADADDVSDAAVMMYVRDASAGELVFLDDESETVVTDRKLVAQLARVQKKAKV